MDGLRFITIVKVKKDHIYNNNNNNNNNKKGVSHGKKKKKNRPLTQASNPLSTSLVVFGGRVNKFFTFYETKIFRLLKNLSPENFGINA